MQKIFTPKQALEKARWYCAKQEHCQSEVLMKLNEWEIDNETATDILVHLIQEGYINEERYAKLFSRSKFNQLGWGKIKIRHMLQQKKISEQCIKIGLLEIDEKKYIAHLKKEIQKKTKELKENNTFILKNKLTKHFYSKGFEPDLIFDLLK